MLNTEQMEEVLEENVEVISVDNEANEMFDTYDSLPPFEKLKLVSSRIGIKVIGNPSSDCPHCHGTGVIDYTPIEGSKIGLPIACTCVPISREYGFVARPNRKERRVMERRNRIHANRKRANKK